MQLDVPPPLDRQCSDPSDGVFRGSTQASVPGATQTALTTAAAQESPSARHRTPGALVLVANPGSAGANRDQLDAALDAARSGGFPALLLQAQEGAELPTLAARGARLAAREQGSVIAVGGDGTINAVAAAAIEAGCSMGVLPQGTFNYFARAHGLPDDPKAAAQVWRAGHLKQVQVGAVNGRPFVVNASLGIYPRLLRARETDSAAYGRSRWVAMWSAARTILRVSHVSRLTIDQDGQREDVRLSLLFIGNNRLQLESLGLPQPAELGEERLAAIRVAPLGWAATLRLLLRGLTGRLAPAEEVSSALFNELTITSRQRRKGRGLQVACDGEVTWMDAPLHVMVMNQRLPLLCPRTE